MNASIKQTETGAVVFSGRDAVEVFRARTIASALRLYAKTGIKANRAYTPTNMLTAASQITGKTFKRGQFEQAAQALTEWAAGEAERMVK